MFVYACRSIVFSLGREVETKTGRQREGGSEVRLLECGDNILSLVHGGKVL